MRLFLACLCACFLATAFARAQSPSPFRPPGPGAGPAGDSSQTFEFTGVVATPARTLICVTTTAERRSRWIEVGGRLEGIKVLEYDTSAQRIVIEAAGRTHTLALKRPAPRPQLAGSPAPLPPPATAMPLPAPEAPPAGVAQAIPTTNEEKEREARMLVSDLLEIGMIQRKAYEEAQKAAEAAKKGGDNPPTAAARPGLHGERPRRRGLPHDPRLEPLTLHRRHTFRFRHRNGPALFSWNEDSHHRHLRLRGQHDRTHAG